LIEEVDGKSAFDHSKVGEILPVNLGGLKVVVKNPIAQLQVDLAIEHKSTYQRTPKNPWMIFWRHSH